MSRPAKLTREQVEALRVWAAIGRNIAEAARNLGVAPNTLRRYLNDQVKTRRPA